MTPSKMILHDTLETFPAVDKSGRRFLLRRLTALDTLRLFKAAGPTLSQNGAWLSMAGLTFSVLEIDGVPIPPPATEPQIESLIERLGDDGIAAIAEMLNPGPDEDDAKVQAGNSHGTQS